MNDLTTICNSFVTAETTVIAATLLKTFRAITPQFYQRLTREQTETQLKGIELQIKNIPPEVLSKMFELAVNEYPRERSRNPQTYFDLNYYLTFYTGAKFEVEYGNPYTNLDEIVF